MENKEALPIVMVSRSRSAFLAMTLANLLWVDFPICLYLAFSEDTDSVATYEVVQVLAALKKNPNVQVIMSFHPLSCSIANIRSSILSALLKTNNVDDQWVLMLDNDLLFHFSILPVLTKYATASLATNKKLAGVTFPFIDVRNERGYLDYDYDRVYEDLSEYQKLYPHYLGSAYHRFATLVILDFMTTIGLWNVTALHDSGVLEFWREYPVGKRGYDFYGSRKMIEQGYEFHMLPSTSENRGEIFWHLWTKQSDEGFFTDTSLTQQKWGQKNGD